MPPITDEIRANRLAYETLRAQAAGMTIEMWQGIPVEERGAVLAGAQQDARQRKAIAARQARAAAATAKPTTDTTSKPTTDTTTATAAAAATPKPTTARAAYDQKYRDAHREQTNTRQNAERAANKQVKADE